MERWKYYLQMRKIKRTQNIWSLFGIEFLYVYLKKLFLAKTSFSFSLGQMKLKEELGGHRTV